MKEKTKIVNKEFDAQILFTILKRHWWTPIIFMLIFWTIAFFYLRYTKPTFESTMFLQLGSRDQAKEVMKIEGIDKGDSEISTEVEVLKSQVLFMEAIKSLNYNISYYSKGSVLTEDKYKSGEFIVQPYELKDSSLVDVPIVLTVDNTNTIFLDYVHQGKKYGATGKLNQRINNKHFDIIIQAKNITDLKKAAVINQIFFQFNSVLSLSNRLLPGLQIIPINIEAKVIQITYTGQHPQLCHDLALAVSSTFLSTDEKNKRKGDENVLKFIDEQLESLSDKLALSQDSLMLLQSSSEFMDPENFETSVYKEVAEIHEEVLKLEDERNVVQTVISKLKSDPNRLEIYRLLLLSHISKNTIKM